jgi:hypothetical protein
MRRYREMSKNASKEPHRVDVQEVYKTSVTGKHRSLCRKTIARDANGHEVFRPNNLIHMNNRTHQKPGEKLPAPANASQKPGRLKLVPPRQATQARKQNGTQNNKQAGARLAQTRAAPNRAPTIRRSR